jgi:2-oxoisovalerate dehydrogenase E2 component (dihydrolipoyl transacylase)
VAELKQFRLPDVGEGLTEADILKWLVQPGDRVVVNQTIVEIETAKAAVELPCPYEGVVADLLVPEGATVDVGTPIISVDVGPDAGSNQPPPAPRGTTSADLVPPPPAEAGSEPGIEGTLAPKDDGRSVLVGYGVKASSTGRRPRKARPVSAVSAPAAAAPAATAAERPPAAPKAAAAAATAPVATSAFTAPHVTEFLQVDVTETMAATARLRSLAEFADVRVSPLLLVARALMVAIARHPMINSSWDADAQEIVVKHYVNLGIAAATERGLVVPNVKDAHALSLPGLARALAELAQTARAGKATPADLSGGTVTITNVGVFGVDTGTPILPPGEAAILAFGQVRDMPWVHQGQLAIRKVTTLALSFDHRIVDGDLGSAVLRDIGAMLEDPLRMIAWS